MFALRQSPPEVKHVVVEQLRHQVSEHRSEEQQTRRFKRKAVGRLGRRAVDARDSACFVCEVGVRMKERRHFRADRPDVGRGHGFGDGQHAEHHHGRNKAEDHHEIRAALAPDFAHDVREPERERVGDQPRGKHEGRAEEPLRQRVAEDYEELRADHIGDHQQRNKHARAEDVELVGARHAG